MDASPHHHRHGFTIIELLLVILIGSILMTLAFAGYQSIRMTASKSQCIQNLRHLYLATLWFADDYNGMIPPSLGPETTVHASFNLNQYWWEQAYLGRYTTNKPTRRRDSVGALTEEEVHVYRCPARTVEGPDSYWAQSGSGKPGITYVMMKFQATPNNHRLNTMQNKSRRLFITEGRGSTLASAYARTGELGQKSNNRLRRYHNKSMNILFLDGHVEQFNGTDAELNLLMVSSNHE